MPGPRRRYQGRALGRRRRDRSDRPIAEQVGGGVVDRCDLAGRERWNSHSARGASPPAIPPRSTHPPPSRRRASQVTAVVVMPCAVNRSSTASPKTTVCPSVVLRRARARRPRWRCGIRSSDDGPGEPQHPVEADAAGLGEVPRRTRPDPHLDLPGPIWGSGRPGSGSSEPGAGRARWRRPAARRRRQANCRCRRRSPPRWGRRPHPGRRIAALACARRYGCRIAVAHADDREHAGLEPFHHVVDAAGEGLDVVRLDGRVHADPQLVAAQGSVGLGVDDPLGPQGHGRRGRGGRRRSCRPRDCAVPGRPRTGSRTPSPRPSRRADGPIRRCVRPPRPGRPRRPATRPGWPSATGSRPPACCRSGPCGSSRVRARGRATAAPTGRPAPR